MSALLQRDDDEDTPITKEELRRAPLTRGKASSPGDDGITYAVLRLLQEVPGNFLLHLPDFTIGGTVIPLCTQYHYLGAPVKISPARPAGRQAHPLVRDLLDRLQSRLTPLRWLTNNSSGIFIPIGRTIYITFIRSVVDPVSPALIQLPKTALEPIENFQNKAMRIILGCPMSTKIVNMQHELGLSPLIERIHTNVACFTVKCLHFPHISPHYSLLIRTSLTPNSPLPPLLPVGRVFIQRVSSMLRSLNLEVLVADVPPGPPPWMLSIPAVSFIPTSKSDPPYLQLQLALEHVATVTSSIPAPYRLYSDGSLQSDSAAGSAVFSPNLEPPQGYWVGQRLRDHSSSTLCELHAILDAVSFICQRGVNAAIVLAKEACILPPRGDGCPLSLTCYVNRVRSAPFYPLCRRRDAERPHSVSIQHYEFVCQRTYSYRRQGVMVRRHNVVSGRLRLGYRPPWQIAGVEGEPSYTERRLCGAPRSDIIQHYCLAYPTVLHLLPQDQPLDAICRHLINHDLVFRCENEARRG
ncbi:hypothetical protein E2C01_011379 [Portunus trituberculatus]|uniref:RNase H type-1 domain-containing protein n=1 Tax=Portunus trituberculatus TaxID=210409 RepID=A0A5B7DAX6_PORTR|nr:hypothetical protein [Portunus trituberculatus]